MLRLRKKTYIPFTVLLILQSYIPSTLFLMLGIIELSLYIIFVLKGKIPINIIPGFNILILFLLWGAVLGLINFNANGIAIRDYVRDIFYYSSPLIFMPIGMIYGKMNIEKEKLFNSIIVAGILLSITSLYSTIQNIAALANVGSVFYWRELTGNGNYCATLALVLLLTYPFSEHLFSQSFKRISLIICLIEFIITLSRTNIMLFIVFFLCVIWNRNLGNKIVSHLPKIAVIIIGFFLITKFLLPNNIVGDYVTKLFNSFTEVSANGDWYNSAMIQNHWRGYETHCALKEWENYNLVSQFIGRGFGKRILVGPYAFTLLKQLNSDGTPATTIAVLHNGYSTMLIKLGAVGVALYLAYYIILVSNGAIASKNKSVDRYSARLFLGCGLFLLIVTYFLNGLYKDGCPFYPIIIMVGYFSYIIKEERRTACSIKLK